MGKANISFPEGMLEEVDRRADAARTTRSAFVQEAVSEYIAALNAEAARSAREVGIARARERMAAVGTHLPPGPDGVTLIRRMRDAVPDWLGSGEQPR